MVNNDIYEEVAVLYTSKKFLAYPSVPIHEGHGMAKMVSPGCFESRYLCHFGQSNSYRNSALFVCNAAISPFMNSICLSRFAKGHGIVSIPLYIHAKPGSFLTSA